MVVESTDTCGTSQDGSAPAARNSKRERRAGLAAAAAGVLFVGALVTSIAESADLLATSTRLAVGLQFVGLIALLYGLYGVRTRYGESLGRVGTAGVVATGLGALACALGLLLGEAGVGFALAFGGLIVMTLGTLPLGAALWRSRDAPRTGAGLLAAAFPLLAVGFALAVGGLTAESPPLYLAGLVGVGASAMAFAIGLVALGHRMWTETETGRGATVGTER